MNNIIIPPASASPEEHAAFLLELARLHPNIAEALSSISGSRFDVARRAEVLTDAIEFCHISILVPAAGQRFGGRFFKTKKNKSK